MWVPFPLATHRATLILTPIRALSQNASLRLYKHHLNLLHARLSLWQHNYKFARTLLRRLLVSFTPSDPPYVVYTARLTLIHLLFSSPYSSSSTLPAARPGSPSSSNPAPHDVQAALDIAQELEALATRNGHVHVVLLVHVLRLGTLVSCGLWTEVASAVSAAEVALGLSYNVPSPSPSTASTTPTASAKGSGKRKREAEQEFVDYENVFETTMAIHALVWSITWFLHIGDASNVTPRVSHLHSFLDSGALEREGCMEGFVEVRFFRLLYFYDVYSPHSLCTSSSPFFSLPFPWSRGFCLKQGT